MTATGVDKPTTIKAPERLGMWAGPGMLILLGSGLLLGGFVPPPGPGASAQDVAAFYQDTVEVRRIAVIMMIVGGTLFIPFGAAIADRLRRIPGMGWAVPLTELGAAVASAVLLMTFGAILLVALLRPDMPDGTYQLLNAVTWLAFVGLWQPGALQAAATAVGVFTDRSDEPIFPRWVGWFSVWMAFGSLMGSLIPFFVSGPFAWNGFIGFFVAACPFFAWFLVMFVQLRKTAAR